jgi:hypothetical protein
MYKTLKRKALLWVHSLASRLEKATSSLLDAQEPFTQRDMTDEILNRYPF